MDLGGDTSARTLLLRRVLVVDRQHFLLPTRLIQLKRRPIVRRLLDARIVRISLTNVISDAQVILRDSIPRFLMLLLLVLVHLD